MSSPQQRRGVQQHGFTIVEVVIAMLVLVIVAGAAVAVVSSTSRTSERAKIVDRQRAIASAVIERAQADRSWITTFACGVGACTGVRDEFVRPDDPLLREDEGTFRHQVAFEAQGVDSPTDGLGAADANRQVPDRFELTVTVTTTGSGIDSGLQPLTMRSTMDMSTSATTGAVRIRACRVDATIDERAGVGECMGSVVGRIPVKAPASGCPIQDASPECVAWRDSSGIGATREMVIRPASVAFTVRGPLGSPSQSTRSVTTDSTGQAELTSLAPGRYEILPAPDPKWTLWAARSTPSAGEFSVRASQVSTAVQVFRPVGHPVTITLRRRNTTDPAFPVVQDGAWVPRAVKLIPVPTGRASTSTGSSLRGWTRIERGATSVDVVDVSPGLYALQLLEYPGDRALTKSDVLSDTPSSFVWVPPLSASESSRVPNRIVLTDVFCDAAGRDSLMNQRITPHQRALGMLTQGFTWYGVDPGVWHGRCTQDNQNESTVEVEGGAGA